MSYGAVFTSEAALSQAIAELARIGLARETIAVAARSGKALDTFVRELGVARIDTGVHHDGVFADLARATGQREATPADALARDLVERGIDVGRAQYFDGRVRAGSFLVVLPTHDEEPAALETLAAHGADLGLANASGLIETIVLRREVLDVGTVAVVTSEVVVRTEIVLERKVIELDLEREDFVIERRDPRTPNAPAEITRIPLRHEEAIIRKETFVTGEVHVRTEQIVDSSVVEETLRHEVLRVDESPNTSVTK